MKSSHTYLPEDERALICGFRFAAGVPAERLRWEDVVGSDRELESTWLHFDLVDVRACEWIESCELLPERARDLLLSNDEYIRFQRIGPGVGGVIGDFDHDLHVEDAMGSFRLYVDRDMMVTARRHPLKGTDRLRRDLLGGATIDSPIEAFADLLFLIASSFQSVATDLDKEIDKIEDRILGGSFRDEGRELGRVRRTLAGLRRHAGSQRNVDFRLLIPDSCTEEEAYQVRRSAEALYAVTQDVEALQVRARLLQDEMAARIGEETNRNIYFLSIISAVFLPITFVTGIFGMNTGGVPWVQTPGGFVLVLIVIAITVALTLGMLRWKRLI